MLLKGIKEMKENAFTCCQLDKNKDLEALSFLSHLPLEDPARSRVDEVLGRVGSHQKDLTRVVRLVSRAMQHFQK